MILNDVIVRQYIQDNMANFKNLSTKEVYIHSSTPIPDVFFIVENREEIAKNSAAWKKQIEKLKQLQCEEVGVGPQGSFDFFGRWGWELLFANN